MRKTITKIIPPELKNLYYHVRTLRKIKKPKLTTYAGHDANILDCCIAYNTYGGYCVPRESFHRPAAQMILAGKVFEAETIQYILQNTNDGDIIHAGTYFGDFLPALSAACQKNHKIWAFEPNPVNYRCAMITAKINDLRNLEIRNLGIGEKTETLPLLVLDRKGKSLGGGSSVLSGKQENYQDFANEQTISANLVSLDDVIPKGRPIALIQLDVEGFEESALKGAMNLIEKWRPTLILETMPSRAFLEEQIFVLGYRKIGEVHDNSILDCFS